MKKLILIFLPIALLVLFACQKEYSMETGLNTGVFATGTLKADALQNCLPITVNGTYTENVALTSANTVTVQVDVLTSGKYYIATDTVNGYWFVDSGFFDGTGLQTITLKGGGKPILPKTDDFSISFLNDFCDFSITVAAGAGGSADPNDADTAWSFTEGSKSYHGHIDTAYIDNTTGTNILVIEGLPATNDTLFSAGLVLGSGTTPSGSYSTTNGTAQFDFLNSSSSTIYKSHQLDGSNLTFTITSYDTTTKILIGTFTGTVLDSGGATKTITLGKLKIRVS
jgi:hypothetical protein